MVRLLLTLMLVIHGVALAAPLTGGYRIGGATFYDPPTDEPQNTHVYFDITGSAAKEIYGTMKAPERKTCGSNDGSLTKIIRNMQCTKYPTKEGYHCWFGIDLKNQRIVGGVVC